VAAALGTGTRGRYLLAATFGNVHGIYAPGRVQLRPEILADGQRALERAHPGARFQYVFTRGAAGVSFVLPLVLFLFVVALGTDCNILMTARLREEMLAGKPSARPWRRP
jgi:fructose-bisphosphate aldolase, class II